MSTSSISPRNTLVAISVLRVFNSASNTPLLSTPFTTPDRNIAFVSSGRSNSASMRSRSSSRSNSRRSTSTRSTSARSRRTTATPLSMSFTRSAPPSARNRRGSPAARSAATTPASNAISPVLAPRAISTARAAAAAASAATSGARDSNAACDALTTASASGVIASSTTRISDGGATARIASNGSRFAAGRRRGEGARVEMEGGARGGGGGRRGDITVPLPRVTRPPPSPISTMRATLPASFAAGTRLSTSRISSVARRSARARGGASWPS
eukprot:29091-Pelagococcus_subviridis.AAC.2